MKKLLGLEYTYDQICRRYGKDYYYLWSAKDSFCHRHVDFYELFFVVSGTPTHYYLGKEEKLRKNQIFFFKPGEEHRIYTEPHQSFHFTFLAKPTFVENFLATIPYLEDVLQGHNCISCEMTDIEFNYIYTLADSLMCKEDEDERAFLFLYNALMIMKWHRDANLQEDRNDYVMDILEKMNSRAYLMVQMDEIYKRYPVSQRILTRDFKTQTGVTIVQYQKIQKLKYAAQLLIKSDYNITDIAGMVGYDSLSYFVRSFNEEYGMTPRKYRESHIRK